MADPGWASRNIRSVCQGSEIAHFAKKAIVGQFVFAFDEAHIWSYRRN